MKKTSTALAVLIAATCTLGFAGKAVAGKQGSNTSEEVLQAYLYNLYVQQQKQQQQQPAPPRETPPPPPPPPPPPR